MSADGLPGSYIPSGGGIFSGSTGGVLGDFVEAAGLNGLQEAAGGWGNVAAHGRKIEDLVAQGVPREQARHQALQQTAPQQQAGLLGGLNAGALLPPALAAVGAYFLLPEKYKVIGSVAAAGAIWYALKPKTA